MEDVEEKKKKKQKQNLNIYVNMVRAQLHGSDVALAVRVPCCEEVGSRLTRSRAEGEKARLWLTSLMTCAC